MEQASQLHSVKLVTLRMVREKSLRYSKNISGAACVIDMVRPWFRGSYREMVVVIGLDCKNIPTLVHTVSLGSPNQSPVFVSSVLKPLLLSNAVGAVLIHNHPASSLVPSASDKDVTAKLKHLGELLEIKLLDHIILDATASNHYSFLASGLLATL